MPLGTGSRIANEVLCQWCEPAGVSLQRSSPQKERAPRRGSERRPNDRAARARGRRVAKPWHGGRESRWSIDPTSALAGRMFRSNRKSDTNGGDWSAECRFGATRMTALHRSSTSTGRLVLRSSCRLLLRCVRARRHEQPFLQRPQFRSRRKWAGALPRHGIFFLLVPSGYSGSALGAARSLQTGPDYILAGRCFHRGQAMKHFTGPHSHCLISVPLPNRSASNGSVRLTIDTPRSTPKKSRQSAIVAVVLIAVAASFAAVPVSYAIHRHLHP